MPQGLYVFLEMVVDHIVDHELMFGTPDKPIL